MKMLHKVITEKNVIIKIFREEGLDWKEKYNNLAGKLYNKLNELVMQRQEKWGVVVPGIGGLFFSGLIHKVLKDCPHSGTSLASLIRAMSIASIEPKQ